MRILTALLISLGLGTSAQAAPAGKIYEVRGEAVIVRNHQSLTAKTDDELLEGDRIRTGAASRVKARMADQTQLVVGSKSSLTIDQYVYSPADESRTAVLNAAFGVFRVWVTKTLRKNSSFEVRTPTAVAGVRGTHFMGIVTDTTSAIASIEGRVAVKNANAKIDGEVTLLDGQGTDVGNNATPTVPITWGNPRLYQLLQDTE